MVCRKAGKGGYIFWSVIVWVTENKEHTEFQVNFVVQESEWLQRLAAEERMSVIDTLSMIICKGMATLDEDGFS